MDSTEIPRNLDISCVFLSSMAACVRGCRPDESTLVDHMLCHHILAPRKSPFIFCTGHEGKFTCSVSAFTVSMLVQMIPMKSEKSTNPPMMTKLTKKKAANHPIPLLPLQLWDVKWGKDEVETKLEHKLHENAVLATI